MHARQVFLLAIVICLLLGVAGAVIIAFFSTPIEKSEIIRDDYLTVKANENKAKDFSFYSGIDNVVSFNVLNGTVKSCEPLNESLYLDWQAGRYEPNWTSGAFGVYEYKGMNYPSGLIGPVHVSYFLFYNEDSYDKVVHWQITSRWEEPNTTNLATGIVLIATGLVTSLGLVLIHMLKPTRCASTRTR